MLTPEAAQAVDGVNANYAGDGRPFGSFCVYDSHTPFVVRPLGLFCASACALHARERRVHSIFTVVHGRAFDTFTVCVYPVKSIDVLLHIISLVLCGQVVFSPAMASETSIAVVSIIYLYCSFGTESPSHIRPQRV